MPYDPRIHFQWALIVDELVTAHIGEPAKRRCSLAKDNPGGLSNAEINGWREKIGMDQITFASIAKRDRVAARLVARKLKFNPVNCRNLGTPAPTLFSAEPELPALWYDARITACIEHPDAEAPAGQCPPA